MAFSYPVVRVACDGVDGAECGAEVDIPVVPPARPAVGVTIVPRSYMGWNIADKRQLCPGCDQKLEEG